MYNLFNDINLYNKNTYINEIHYLNKKKSSKLIVKLFFLPKKKK
jgi:hypothetical protein